MTAIVALALAAHTTDAAAYCRTTTCEPEVETCPRDDRGCMTTGTPLRWSKLPVIYRVSARGSSTFARDDARAKISAAFDKWTHAVCADGRRTSLTVVEGDAMPEDKRLGQKRAAEPFGIYFRDEAWPYAGATTTLAITNQDFGKSSGRIIYSDIELNTPRTPLSVLEVVVTHEAGHYLGLAHSRMPGSIMAESYDPSTDREPNADDLSAVCELFPPDGLPPEEEDGCHVSTTASTSSAASTATIATLMAIAAVSAMRRRRRLPQR